MVKITVKGGIWKNSEDEILKAAVMKYGKNHWARVASLMTRKTGKQCKARWFEWLDPRIKKTDWTREEDEKLLHLSKLMPTQWRTIAAAVGRTAAQCIERYEKLLDIAAAEDNSSDQNQAQSLSSLKQMKPGDIDPHPETKPARPDPVDMDDDEKEMLNEARARLANTNGKKAKRKARERQLEMARRVAALQKSREIKAAGFATGGGGYGHVQRLLGFSKSSSNKKRKKNGAEVDYLTEIPFERSVPIGFYDVLKEDREGEELRTDKEKRRDMIEKMNKKIEERKERNKKRRDKNKKGGVNDSDVALEKELRKLEEQQAHEENLKYKRNIVRLSLPSPLVSDEEMQDIAKRVGAEKIAAAASQLRTPATGDMVAEEARAQLLRSQLQTPLLETTTPTVDFSSLSGTGFSGATPLVSLSRTISERPMSVLAHLNEGVVPDTGLVSKRSRKTAEKVRETLSQMFKNLPEAKDEYELVTKMDIDRDEEIGEFDSMGTKKRKLDKRDYEDVVEDRRKSKLKTQELKKSTVARLKLSIPHPNNVFFENSAKFVKSEVEKAIVNEMKRMIATDFLKFSESTKTNLENIDIADLEANSYLDEFSFQELRNAQRLVSEEAGKPSIGGSISVEEYARISEDAFKEVEIDNSTQQQLKVIVKKCKKLEKHVKILTAKLGEKDQQIVEEIENKNGENVDLRDLSMKNRFYRTLVGHEDKVLEKRLSEWQEKCSEIKKVESDLQAQYFQITRGI